MECSRILQTTSTSVLDQFFAVFVFTYVGSDGFSRYINCFAKKNSVTSTDLYKLTMQLD